MFFTSFKLIFNTLSCLHFHDHTVRPEEHSTACVRRTQRANGHEHHFQREEGDQMARVAYQFPAGESEFE